MPVCVTTSETLQGNCDDYKAENYWPTYEAIVCFAWAFCWKSSEAVQICLLFHSAFVLKSAIILIHNYEQINTCNLSD